MFKTQSCYTVPARDAILRGYTVTLIYDWYYDICHSHIDYRLAHSVTL
jgi:hypothetical protein